MGRVLVMVRVEFGKSLGRIVYELGWRWSMGKGLDQIEPKYLKSNVMITFPKET